MAKVASNGMIDGGLTTYGTCTTLTVCAGQPVSQADIAAKALATVTIAATDFTVGNGTTSGRKSTVAAQSAIPITANGTADHVAVDNGIDYYITTATAQALVSGGTVSTPAFDREISDPV